MAVVRDVMTPNPVSLDTSATLLDAARAMRDVAEGKAIGIVSMADLAAHLQPDTPIAEISRSNAKY